MSEPNNHPLAILLANVLGVEIEEISEDTSPDTMSAWDSITHLNLIMAIEETFEVEMSPDEAMDLNSFKLLRMFLEEKEKL